MICLLTYIYLLLDINRFLQEKRIMINRWFSNSFYDSCTYLKVCPYILIASLEAEGKFEEAHNIRVNLLAFVYDRINKVDFFSEIIRDAKLKFDWDLSFENFFKITNQIIDLLGKPSELAPNPIPNLVRFVDDANTLNDIDSTQVLVPKVLTSHPCDTAPLSPEVSVSPSIVNTFPELSTPTQTIPELPFNSSPSSFTLQIELSYANKATPCLPDIPSNPSKSSFPLSLENLPFAEKATPCLPELPLSPSMPSLPVSPEIAIAAGLSIPELVVAVVVTGLVCYTIYRIYSNYFIKTEPISSTPVDPSSPVVENGTLHSPLESFEFINIFYDLKEILLVCFILVLLITWKNSYCYYLFRSIFI